MKRLQHRDGVFWRTYWITAVICMLGYLFLIGGRSVWADEAYTFSLIRHNYREICRITAADVHPPLYYLILKLFIQPFGYNLICAKLVSIIPYMFIILFGGYQFRKLFDEKTAILFMHFFPLFPLGCVYAVEVRMYSLAAAFVFANGVYAYRCFKDKENGMMNWGLFILFGIGAAYTHYYAFVSVGVIYGLLCVAIVVKKKKKFVMWITAVAFSIAAYLPWLKSFAEQLDYKVKHEYWIEEITIATIKEYANSIFGAKGLEIVRFSFFFALTYLAALVYMLIKKEKQGIWICICCLSVPIGTILVGITASLLVRPVFVIRYVVPSIPVLVAFMAISGGVMSKKILLPCYAVALIGGVSNYAVSVHDEYAVIENVIDDEMLAAYDNVDCYIVLTKSGHISSVLAYYEHELPIYIADKITDSNPFENQKEICEFKASENNLLLMFLDVGEMPDETYAFTYQWEYIGKYNECGNYTDVYLLVADS